MAGPVLGEFYSQTPQNVMVSGFDAILIELKTDA
jgi:hypothetical protein